MKKIVAFACVAMSFVLSGCVDSDEVKMVKAGKLNSCQKGTVEKMVDSFMGSPSWKSGVAKNGQEFVNVSGDISYQEKKVRAEVQFFIDKKNKTFEFNAFEINEVPQNNFMAYALLGKMCDSIK